MDDSQAKTRELTRLCAAHARPAPPSVRAGRAIFWARALLGAVLVAGVLAGCRDGDDAAEDDASTTVATALPAVRARNAVEARGKVVPARHGALAFPVGGAVAKVLVEEGDTVDVGDILVRLDSAQQAAGVLQATADRAVAEAMVAAAEVAASSVGSDAAQAELAAARARLDQAQAALEQAEVQLDRTELRAPFGGRVAAVHVSEGEVAPAGAAVVDLGDDTAWLVETEDLTELHVVGIEPGDPATITVDAVPDLELEGTVERVSTRGEVRAGDVVYRIVVRPDAHDSRLRWNMTATVTITRGKSRD